MSEPADFLAKLAENDPKAAERLRKACGVVHATKTRVGVRRIKCQIEDDQSV